MLFQNIYMSEFRLHFELIFRVTFITDSMYVTILIVLSYMSLLAVLVLCSKICVFIGYISNTFLTNN